MKMSLPDAINRTCGVLGALCFAISALATLAPLPALAGETKSFVLDDQKALSAGELDGVAVESVGQVVTSVTTQRISIPEATVARAVLTAGDGTTYIGTAPKGTVYRLRKNVLSVYAETGALMATALAHDGKGALFVGTTPGGKVLRVTGEGKVETFCDLKGSEHVWALAYDARRKVLFAATGPEGHIFSIDARGKAQIYYDSDADHVMTLALDKQGTLFAGTSDEALLLAITAPGKARVVHDFEGSELTALALHGDTLAVAENTFPRKGKKPAPNLGKATKGAPPKAAPAAITKAAVGSGRLWRVDVDGNAHQLLEDSQGHITAVAFTKDGYVLSASSKAGKLVRVHPDGTQAVWLDVDEKDILALDTTGDPVRFVTGDGAAVYTIEARPAEKGTWTSEALDAKFQAHFGALDFRGRGKLAFQTRSGNSKKPDNTWSDWSTALVKAGPISSPAARFLQVRAALDRGAVLYAVVAHYLPRNQAPIVRSVEGEPVTNKKTKDKTPEHPTTIYRLKWTVDNPDDDALRFRLSYRPESARVLRPMFREHITWTQPTLDWNTEAIADGYYLVQVEASDELENPEPHALRAVGYSEPILVDNHAPHIDGLSRRGDAIVGIAKDALGPIKTLHYKLDNEQWQPLAADDGMLDTAEERFSVRLPAGLDKGPHVVAVRATDLRNNPITTELEFEQP